MLSWFRHPDFVTDAIKKTVRKAHQGDDPRATTVILYDPETGWGGATALPDKPGGDLQFNACRVGRVGRTNIVAMNDAHWSLAKLTMGGFDASASD